MVLNSQTSIVFSLEEGPGVLFKALAVFALREINLTKVCFCYPSNGWCLFIVSFAGICSGSVHCLLCFVLQIESRPLRKQLVGASDDNNNGYPK